VSTTSLSTPCATGETHQFVDNPLTPRNFHEHEDHQRFFSEHSVKKGTEVASAFLHTLANFSALKKQEGNRSLALGGMQDARG
jgi:hypothetical protein